LQLFFSFGAAPPAPASSLVVELQLTNVSGGKVSGCLGSEIGIQLIDRQGNTPRRCIRNGSASPIRQLEELPNNPAFPL
jgi:hypothetical protein